MADAHRRLFGAYLSLRGGRTPQDGNAHSALQLMPRPSFPRALSHRVGAPRELFLTCHRTPIPRAPIRSYRAVGNVPPEVTAVALLPLLQEVGQVVDFQ